MNKIYFNLFHSKYNSLKRYPLLIKRLVKTLPKNIDFKVTTTIKPTDYRGFKNHEGKFILKTIRLPDDLEKSINQTLSNYSLANLINDAPHFNSFLNERHVPIDKHLTSIRSNIIDQMDSETIDETVPDEEIDKIVNKKISSKINQWKPIDYNERTSLLYLISRFASDYAAVYQILNEIKLKDETFIPSHLFDFGSGLGTVMWAMNTLWKPTYIEENFNCDFSYHMTTFADLITRMGSVNNPAKFKNIVYKRNIPKSSNADYELVTSAFSLLEFANRLQRFDLLENLFGKVKKNGYLVLVEMGNKQGFKLINEARDFILNELLSSKENEDKWSLFAPCPHHFKCKLIDETLKCKFNAKYMPIQLNKNKTKHNDAKEFSYSYLVFKNSSQVPETCKWPRLVIRDPIKTKSAFNSWTCNVDGNIDHLITSKNRNKVLNKLVRYSSVGDNLPINYSKDNIFINNNNEIEEIKE